MSSNKPLTAILIITIFLLIINVSFINADAGDFSYVQGSNPGAICPGSTALIIDTITSKNTNDLQFTIINTGSSSGFTTSVPPGFILKSGYSKSVYTYISPRTTTPVGKYTLELNVDSGIKSQTISHSIEIKDCRSFELRAVSDSKSLCPSSVEKFDFVLSNTGETKETFDLSLEGQAAPWLTLSEVSVTLDRQQSKTIFVYLSTPSSALGKYEFNLIATARSNKNVKSVSSFINVNPCFQYTLTSEKDSISLCENTKEIIPLGITNQGTVDNNYELQIEGPDWASLENNKITVAKDQTSSANIIINPGYGIEGNFKILFKAITEKGQIESSNEFNVNVKKCHGVDVQVEKNQDKICNSLSNTYNIMVKNTGEFSKEYKLELIGPVWSTLNADRIKLEPNEERKLSLTINPGFDAEASDYDIIVRAIALDSSRVSSESKLTISTISREECYKPSIGINNKEVEVYYDSAATIPVVIENKGNQQATYDIAVSGTAANFIHLNPATATIMPNNAEIVYLYIAPNKETTDGTYSAAISVRLKDSTILASDTIQIKISQSKVPVEVTPTETTPRKNLWQRIKEFFTGKKETPTQITETEIPEEPSTTEEQPAEEGNETLGNETGTAIPVLTEPNVTETVEPEVTGQVPSQIAGPESRAIDFNIANKYLINQEKNQEVNFKVNNEDHSVKITDVSADTVTIIIKSEPQYSNLKVGESKEFDTDGDGTNDLKVTLLGIENGKARVVYENLLAESIASAAENLTEITPTETTTAPETPETTPSENSETPKGPGFFKLYLKYIISGLIILVLLILVIKYRKNIVEFFEEEVEVPVKKETTEHKKETIEHKKETPKEHPKEQTKEHIAKKETVKETKETKKEETKKEEKTSKEEKKPAKKKKEVSEEEYY
ncbi:MAG: hypothetical protein AABW41_04240 [Nanoarchaeota archaeon]